MLNSSFMSLVSQHSKTATMLYGEDYQNNPTYLNSQYKQMYDIQYLKMLTFLN